MSEFKNHCCAGPVFFIVIAKLKILFLRYFDSKHICNVTQMNNVWGDLQMHMRKQKTVCRTATLALRHPLLMVLIHLTGVVEFFRKTKLIVFFYPILKKCLFIIKL